MACLVNRESHILEILEFLVLVILAHLEPHRLEWKLTKRTGNDIFMKLFTSVCHISFKGDDAPENEL